MNPLKGSKCVTLAKDHSKTIQRGEYGGNEMEKVEALRYTRCNSK